MEAREHSIQQVFCDGQILRIPFFQRTYTWGEKNWERFDNDMLGLMDSPDDHKYFLGSLILKADPITAEERYDFVTSKFVVIDGQQRLTTLSIYLKALINRIGDDRASNQFNNLFLHGHDNSFLPKLSHSIDDREAYRDIMLDNASNLTIYRSRNVIDAYNYFINKFITRTPADLRVLLTSIYSKIIFVAITLNNNDDEQQIFDTLNSLGVKLTIDELMKNFLYRSDDEDAYNNNWRPVFDGRDLEFWRKHELAVSQAADTKNTVIYNFFYDFVRIKMWDYNLTPQQRQQFVKKSDVLETCKSFVESFGTDRQDLANEIIEYAKLYRKYFDRNLLYEPIPRYPGIERVACISMSSVAVRPYLLYVLRNVDDETERSRIFEFIETYLVRRAICGADNRTSEIWTEELINAGVTTFEELQRRIMNKGMDTANHMPSDDEVADAIMNRGKNIQMTLYLIESKLTANLGNGYNYFTTLQIIPSPARGNMNTYPAHANEDMERERKRRTKTLGNHILLNLGNEVDGSDEIPGETNRVRRLLNKPFAEKKDGAQAYVGNIMSMTWFRNSNAWSESDIDGRNQKLIEYINGRFWPLPATW